MLSAEEKPMLPHLPSQVGGFEWRLLNAADGPDFASILHRIEKYDSLPYRTSEAEVEELLVQASACTLVGGFVHGSIRCYGLVRIRNSRPNVAVCQGGVDPIMRGRGLGGLLVSWQTEEARRLLAGVDHPQKQILFYVEDGQVDLEGHLRLLGYEWAGSSYDLRAFLRDDGEGETRPVEVPALPSFLTLESWESLEEAQILAVANQVRLENNEEVPFTLESWLAGRDDFNPQWSFVAVDRSADRLRPVGFVMASKYSQDWSALGWREGTIDMLAVLPGYREGGRAAQALIAKSMSAQRQDGMEATAAGVSSSNSSQALSIYAALGFETVGTTRVYSKAL
ncbi:MAG: GNAT family N-acetyltransferase [Actinomycetaceae bacterium]|nr:GNAT family N-acetyltransferase [Actinomycetaceae bacterium]